MDIQTVDYYSHKAGELFNEGYNCAQSVFLAFEDVLALDRDYALRLSSSFGAGMGRLREVGGAVSAMFAITGIVYGYANPQDDAMKAIHYQRIQELAQTFEKKHGSIICRDLLGLDEKRSVPTPQKRDKTYYATRPCKKLVESAAGIMGQYLNDHPVLN
jgi:C_GCAxxG_C_C family probable redox protein